MPYTAGPEERAHQSVMSLSNHYKLAGSIKPVPMLPVFAELGPGLSLGFSMLALLLGAKECWNFENDDPRTCYTEDNQAVLPFLVEELITNKSNRNHRLPIFDKSRSYLEERAKAISAALDGDNNEEAAIHVQHNWQHNSQDHIENRIDLLVSHTTMEHVRQTVDCYQRIHKMLRVGGIQSHYYGWCDHNLTDHQNGHLAMTREARDKRFPSAMSFLNLLPPNFHKGVMSDLGSNVTVWELHPYVFNKGGWSDRPVIDAYELPFDTLYTESEIHIRHGFGEAVKMK